MHRHFQATTNQRRLRNIFLLFGVQFSGLFFIYFIYPYFQIWNSNGGILPLFYEQELEYYSNLKKETPIPSCNIFATNSATTPVHPLYPPQFCKELLVLGKDNFGTNSPDPDVSLVCSYKLIGPHVRRNPLFISPRHIEGICDHRLAPKANDWTDFCYLKQQLVKEPIFKLTDWNLEYENKNYPFSTHINAYKITDGYLYKNMIFSKKCRYSHLTHDTNGIAKDTPYCIEVFADKVVPKVDYTNHTSKQSTCDSYDIFHRLSLTSNVWYKRDPVELRNVLSMGRVKKLLYIYATWDSEIFHSFYEIFPYIFFMKPLLQKDPTISIRIHQKTNQKFLTYFASKLGISENRFISQWTTPNLILDEAYVLVDEMYVVAPYPSAILEQPSYDLIAMYSKLFCDHVDYSLIKPAWIDTVRPLRVALIQHGKGFGSRYINSTFIMEYCNQL